MQIVQYYQESLSLIVRQMQTAIFTAKVATHVKTRPSIVLKMVDATFNALVNHQLNIIKRMMEYHILVRKQYYKFAVERGK